VININKLLAEYGLLLDEDRLEEWVDLFTENAQYKVVTRENKKLNLPLAVIWCDNKNMIRDRIHSYRHVNEHNLHWDRHIIGHPRIQPINATEWQVQASYSLFQTNLEGRSILFSVGMYDFKIIEQDDALKIQFLEVISDTGSFETLLATPI
jgi:3-phenylpropionate/cinnamic acid dioxygenase small subunit